MSVGLYDEALVKKISNWTQDTNIKVYGVNETSRMFREIADTTKDKPIKLPIISISRPGGFTILNTGKRPNTFDGYTLDATTESASQLNAIPISIPYQIDVYTRYQNECDEYIRNLVFNFINFPKVTINIPYNNENRLHDSFIELDADIENNSDIPERLIAGQFTRMSIKLTIDDAYLFDVRYRDVYSIGYEFEIED